MNVFQRSVHRLPTLALYRSLLRLAKSNDLDAELRSRIRGCVRKQFRLKKKMYSVRIIQHGLVNAFKVHICLEAKLIKLHSTMERAINGDAEALVKLNTHFPPPRPKEPVTKEQIKSPPRPVMAPSPRIRAPAIHYTQFTLPILILPGTNRRRRSALFQNKFNHIRLMTETFGYINFMVDHARREQQFLNMLNIITKSNWRGADMECGVREMKQMVNDLGMYMSEIEVTENKAVEEELRKWVREHPSAKYKALGERMTRKERMEWKRWRIQVNAVKRKRKEQNKRVKFMRVWQAKYGKETSPHYHQPRQRSLKRFAKKLRKIRLRQR